MEAAPCRCNPQSGTGAGFQIGRNRHLRNLASVLLARFRSRCPRWTDLVPPGRSNLTRNPPPFSPRNRQSAGVEFSPLNIRRLNVWRGGERRLIRDCGMENGRKWDTTHVSPQAKSPPRKQRATTLTKLPPKERSADVGGSPLQHPPICLNLRDHGMANGRKWDTSHLSPRAWPPTCPPNDKFPPRNNTVGGCWRCPPSTSADSASGGRHSHSALDGGPPGG